MPEDYESRLEKILAELRPGKRNILQDHINELSGQEREDFIKEVIKEYDAAKKAATEKVSEETEKAESSLFVLEQDNTTESENDEDEPSEETPDIESGIVNALKVDEHSEKAEMPKHLPVSREPADEEATSFTQAPMHTKKPSKGKVPVIIICVLLTLIAAFGLSYVFFLSKNAAFIEFASKLGIPLPAVQSESVTMPETTEAATTEAAPTPTPSPTPEPTPTPVPTPTEIPTPTPIAPKSNAPNLKGIKVVIDPGHQEKTDYKKEPYKKGATTGKYRCTSGAVGVTTKQKEYELTLDTALMLKDYLEQCGATVILTRTENDVNLSNKERAAIAVKAKPTLFIRLHADALSSSSVKGVRVYIPKSGSLNKAANGDKLGKLVAAAAKTSFRGTKATNQYAGLNYATSIRSYQIVLGYLSNSEDDQRLADLENRYEMCAAIAEFCGTFKKK